MEVPSYHVELRAFPHVARVFNLDRETLDAVYLRPYVAGEMIEYDDRRWAAEKTKLTVFTGPEVSGAQRSMGRGWGEVTRHGTDVTEAVLAEIHRGADARPEVESLKDVIGEVAAGGGLGFPDVMALAAAGHPNWRASEQLSLAEQTVWEMLHQHRLEMVDGELAVVASERWQELVLSWATWTQTAQSPVRLQALAPPAEPAT
jgi:hypothetical protein